MNSDLKNTAIADHSNYDVVMMMIIIIINSREGEEEEEVVCVTYK